MECSTQAYAHSHHTFTHILELTKTRFNDATAAYICGCRYNCTYSNAFTISHKNAQIIGATIRGSNHRRIFGLFGYNPNNVRTFAVDVAKISCAETPFGVPPGVSMFRIDASAMAPHAQCCGRHTETLCPAPLKSVSAAKAIGASEVKTIRLSGVS